MGAPMARWSLRMLGPLLLEGDGAPLAGFRSDKVRALLAYLAMHVDRPWSRATLADLLWPDQSESTARGNLRNALSNLRHVIGDRHAWTPFLRVTQAAVEANGAAERWVDVDAFLSLRSGAGDEPVAGVDAADVTRLEGALALYRGPFLEGFTIDSAPFESWLATTREALRLEAVRTARALAWARADMGDVAAAAAATRRWLELDPWEETAHRTLMRLLQLQGQRTAALAQYDVCRRILAQELGLEPETETTRQYEAILADRATASVDVGVGLAWPGLDVRVARSEPDAVFVARDEQLAVLTSALERTAAGAAGVAFVTGEPGSGKTALLAEFARRALTQHAQLIVTWGQGNAFTGRGDPFEPFRHAARMLSGEAQAPPDLGAGCAEVARRLWRLLPVTIDALLEHGTELVDRFVSGPALLAFARRHHGVSGAQLLELERRLAPPPSGQGPQAAGRPTALFEPFIQVVRSLGERRPLLLILDDLQWIDPDSSDLLFHLVRGLAGRRVLVLGAYRPDEAVRRHDRVERSFVDVVEELLATSNSVRIDLTRAAGRPFVDALLDREPNALSVTFRDRVQRRTSGNPLFTIELLRAMQLRGELRRDRRGRWVEGRALSWDQVPARVEAVIERRIGHVSPACRELLTVASVEGEQFTAEVAAALAGQPLARAYDLLSEEAGRRHLLVVAHTVRSVGGGTLALYRFRHGLFQTYLYQRLDPVERAHLHGEIAHALERAYRPDPGQHPGLAVTLAHHFAAAGRAEEAVGAYAESARHAMRLSAHAEAVVHLQRALSLLGSLPASTARDRQELELQLALGPPLTASKGWSPPELAAAYDRAQELCAGIDDGAQLIPTLWLLSVFRIGRSEHAQVQRLWERMTRLARASGDPALIALTSLNVATFYQGRFVEARRMFEDACAEPDLETQRRLAQRFGMAPAAVALAYLAECLWILDLPAEAERRGAEARALAARIAHPMTTCYAIGRACWLAALRGDAETTGELAAELRSVAAPRQLQPFVLAASFFARLAAIRSGDGEGVTDLDAMHEATERYLRGGTSLNRAAFLAHYAQACGWVGLFPRGLAAVDRSLAEAERTGELWFQAEAWRIKGELLSLSTGSGEQPERRMRAAQACLRTAYRSAGRQGAPAFQRRAAEALAAHTDVWA